MDTSMQGYTQPSQNGECVSADIQQLKQQLEKMNRSDNLNLDSVEDRKDGKRLDRNKSAGILTKNGQGYDKVLPVVNDQKNYQEEFEEIAKLEKKVLEQEQKIKLTVQQADLERKFERQSKLLQIQEIQMIAKKQEEERKAEEVKKMQEDLQQKKAQEIVEAQAKIKMLINDSLAERLAQKEARRLQQKQKQPHCMHNQKVSASEERRVKRITDHVKEFEHGKKCQKGLLGGQNRSKSYIYKGCMRPMASKFEPNCINITKQNLSYPITHQIMHENTTNTNWMSSLRGEHHKFVCKKGDKHTQKENLCLQEEKAFIVHTGPTYSNLPIYKGGKGYIGDYRNTSNDIGDMHILNNAIVAGKYDYIIDEYIESPRQLYPKQDEMRSSPYNELKNEIMNYVKEDKVIDDIFLNNLNSKELIGYYRNVVRKGKDDLAQFIKGN